MVVVPRVAAAVVVLGGTARALFDAAADAADADAVVDAVAVVVVAAAAAAENADDGVVEPWLMTSCSWHRAGDPRGWRRCRSRGNSNRGIPRTARFRSIAL